MLSIALSVRPLKQHPPFPTSGWLLTCCCLKTSIVWAFPGPMIALCAQMPIGKLNQSLFVLLLPFSECFDDTSINIVEQWAYWVNTVLPRAMRKPVSTQSKTPVTNRARRSSRCFSILSKINQRSARLETFQIRSDWRDNLVQCRTRCHHVCFFKMWHQV